MALIKGMLAIFDNPLVQALPRTVVFQYNPTQVTRVFTIAAGGGGTAAGSALDAAKPPQEEYSLTLELDATDGLERGGPVSLSSGIAPQLAAIEMILQPAGSSLLGAAALRLLGRGGAAIPPSRVPLVLLVWGPGRVTPVRVKTLTVRETAFDELLNPIHATADLGLTVLREVDLDAGETAARGAARLYRLQRELRAVLQLPQTLELR
jgi:hypothetical protein